MDEIRRSVDMFAQPKTIKGPWGVNGPQAIFIAAHNLLKNDQKHTAVRGTAGESEKGRVEGDRKSMFFYK